LLRGKLGTLRRRPELEGQEVSRYTVLWFSKGVVLDKLNIKPGLAILDAS